MIGLTDRQAELLSFIIEQLKTVQRAPTVREIGQALGIASTNGVNEHLQALARKSYVEIGKDGEPAARSLRVLRWPDGAAFRLVAMRGEQ